MVNDRVQIKLTESEINPNDWCLIAPENGAVLWFLGVVRKNSSNGEVQGIYYDHEPVLAEKKMLKIASEAQEGWGDDLQVILVHRVGYVSAGQIGIMIGVSSVHRDYAYSASRYVIEQVKLRVPIWKQEHMVDGRKIWLKGTPIHEIEL